MDLLLCHRDTEHSARSQRSISTCSSGDHTYCLAVLPVSFFITQLAYGTVLERSTVQGKAERRVREHYSSLKKSSSRPRKGYSPDTSPLPLPIVPAASLTSHRGCEDSLVNVCEVQCRWRELCKC